MFQDGSQLVLANQSSGDICLAVHFVHDLLFDILYTKQHF